MSGGKQQFKYYDFMMAAFVVVLICSNIIGPAKLASIDVMGSSYIYGAGVLFFPLSYVFGDVLTEVYGYARARKVIWAGFVGVIFASIMSFIIVKLPPAPGWEGQAAYDQIFGQVPRIVLASVTAFLVGEMINAYVMARMKIWTKGKHLWTRTIGSTVVGQGMDSMIFYPIAFYGIWENDILLIVMFSNFLIKVGWEALLTPVTYKLVGMLKRAENVDIFDDDTDFTPFKIT
jgi:queuosine precursor transporter